MLSFLDRPYPYFFTRKRNLWMALGCGVFIWAMQALLLDHTVYYAHFDMSEWLFSVLVGSITAVSVLLVFDLFPMVAISEEKRENWTLLREIAIIALLLVVIACANFAFMVVAARDYRLALTFVVFFGILFNTLVIGMVPTTIITWIKYTINLRENLKHAELNNERLRQILAQRPEATEHIQISIPSDNRSEMIEFVLTDLLFIRSDGNYIEVFTKGDEQANMKIYRSSIQRLVDVLTDHPFIVRTHRSYLVNVLNVQSTDGNARNYQLTFEGVEQSVPVSRNRFDAFNEALHSQQPNVARQSLVLQPS